MQSLANFTKRPLFSFALLASVYLFTIIFLPANSATVHTYNFSNFEYRFILLAIGLPLMLIWLAAFYGSKKLLDYAITIKKTPEGAYFEQLAYGCLWLAWSIALPLVTSTLLGSLANTWPELKPASVIIANYLALVLPLAAFTIIGNATWHLLKTTKARLSLMSIRVLVLLTITIGSIYCYTTFNGSVSTELSNSDNAYYLPTWLIIISILIPNIYLWFVGLFAVYKLSLFSQQARGVLYKKALRLVVIGLVAVIFSLVALQYVVGVQPRDWHLMLNAELLIILFLRLLSGFGFALLALGAIRLKRIEDV